MSVLTTRNSRDKLHRRMVRDGKSRDIHWEKVGRGRAVGYRRMAGSSVGRWHGRLYTPTGSGSPYKRQALGDADDVAAQNGKDILSYGSAVAMAATFNPWAAALEADEGFSFGQAVDAYVQWAETNTSSVVTIRTTLNRYVRPVLGDVPVAAVSRQRLEEWKASLASWPKVYKGNDEREPRTTDERLARMNTANKTLSYFKSCLNHCQELGLLTCNDSSWRLLKKFKNVDQPGRKGKLPFFTQAELAAYLDAIQDVGFRQLASAAAWTGLRKSELADLKVSDVDIEKSRLTIRRGKGGYSHTHRLGDRALALFESVTLGRDPEDNVFLCTSPRSKGRPWKGCRHTFWHDKAIKAANIKSGGPFHCLRHSYCTHYLTSGGSVFILAKQLGHHDTTQIMRTYGHLLDDDRLIEARKHEPMVDVGTDNTEAEATTLH